MKAELVWAQVSEQEKNIAEVEERIKEHRGALLPAHFPPGFVARPFLRCAAVLERNEARVKLFEEKRAARLDEDTALAAELKVVSESIDALAQDVLERDEALSVLRRKKAELDRKVVTFPKKIEALTKRIARLDEDMARAQARAGDDDAEQRARLAELAKLRESVRGLETQVGNFVSVATCAL